MKLVGSNYNNNNVSFTSFSKDKSLTGVKKWIYNKMPTYEVGNKTKKFFEDCDLLISSPEQRAVIGATALIIQPLIDYYNPSVDEQTRNISVLKTIAKVVVGTISGVLIRALCIVGAKKFSATEKIANGLLKKAKSNSFLLPKNDDLKITKEQIDKFTKAMGTLIATIVMIVTNFAIDAPLTNIMTNWLKSVHDKYNNTNKSDDLTNSSSEISNEKTGGVV